MSKPAKQKKTKKTTYTAEVKFYVEVEVTVTETTAADGTVTDDLERITDSLLDGIYIAAENVDGEVTDLEIK